MDTQGVLLTEDAVVARTYREEGFQPIPPYRPPDEEYAKVLQRMIGVCTDVFITNSPRREIFLARRRSKPMTGWWWFGGGQLPNETHLEAAIRNFKRETKIVLRPEQLVYRAKNDYLWKDRQQEPQTIGCHMEGHTFTVELSDAEIAGIQLEPNEFEADKGLTAFNREKLVVEGVFPAVLHLYDQVFPATPKAAYGEMRIVSTDARRSIAEFNSDRSSVQLFQVQAADLPLGKHAHGKKSEAFTILEGGGYVLTCAVDSRGDKLGKVEMHPLSEGSVIELPPFVAHTFYLDPGTRMHCYASKPFDPSDFIPTPFLVREAAATA